MGGENITREDFLKIGGSAGLALLFSPLIKAADFLNLNKGKDRAYWGLTDDHLTQLLVYTNVGIASTWPSFFGSFVRQERDYDGVSFFPHLSDELAGNITWNMKSISPNFGANNNYGLAANDQIVLEVHNVHDEKKKFYYFFDIPALRNGLFEGKASDLVTKIYLDNYYNNRSHALWSGSKSWSGGWGEKLIADEKLPIFEHHSKKLLDIIYNMYIRNGEYSPPRPKIPGTGSGNEG